MLFGSTLYNIATEFMPKAMEHVPEDIKGLIAANVVMLTFGQKDYRLSKFEKIVAYPHPFPSPQYPKHLHSSEIFDEDGVILFSLEQLIPGATRQTQFYNIALHEYIKIFMLTYPDYNYPKIDTDVAKKLEIISGFKNEKVQNYIGLPMLEPSILAINYFFTFPQNFYNQQPDIFESYTKIFNQNPLDHQSPVIDNEKRGRPNLAFNWLVYLAKNCELESAKLPKMLYKTYLTSSFRSFRNQRHKKWHSVN